MRERLTTALAISFMALAAPSFSGAHAAEVDSSKSTIIGAQTQINVARIKAALNLTPEQLRSWAALENALISIAREQAQHFADAPASRRVVAIAFNNTNVQRLATAAMPLIKMLKPEQKKVAQDMAQQIGLGAYAAFI